MDNRPGRQVLPVSKLGLEPLRQERVADIHASVHRLRRQFFVLLQVVNGAVRPGEVACNAICRSSNSSGLST